MKVTPATSAKVVPPDAGFSKKVQKELRRTAGNKNPPQVVPRRALSDFVNQRHVKGKNSKTPKTTTKKSAGRKGKKASSSKPRICPVYDHLRSGKKVPCNQFFLVTMAITLSEARPLGRFFV